jgi:hypothetical protein
MIIWWGNRNHHRKGFDGGRRYDAVYQPEIFIALTPQEYFYKYNLLWHLE